MADEKMLSAVANHLARRSLSADQMEKIADALEGSRHPIRGIDVCTHGICIDFDVQGGLGALDIKDIAGVAVGSIGSIEIFPEGIIMPDAARVRMTQKF